MEAVRPKRRVREEVEEDEENELEVPLLDLKEGLEPAPEAA